MYEYEYDIFKKEIVTDCKLYPTEVFGNEAEWLWASNDMYENVDSKKVGKWMLFVSKYRVNEVWDKIKMAVTTGDLWHSKVSTTDPDKYKAKYAIMVYTKDYTDVNDVIHVLNYLESSGLAPSQERIFYKTDEQTRAGIYKGGRQRPWIYSSDTIRDEVITTTYEYDVHKKEIVTDSKLYPTDILKNESYWLYARNNKYENVDRKKVGKWMLFVSKNRVNEVWDKIKIGVTDGELRSSKVSTTDLDKSTTRYAIMIYTKDYTDLSDVIRVLNYLESSGLKLPEERIFYKTNEQTRAGIYRGGKQRPWIYSSDTIRDEVITTT